MPLTCELIMLDRDTCGLTATKCLKCDGAFCSICIKEHDKVHQPLPKSPRKLEMILGICKVCQAVGAYVRDRGCSACGGETETLKAAVRANSRDITFYTEG